MKPSSRYIVIGAASAIAMVSVIAGGGYAAYHALKNEPAETAAAPQPKRYVAYQQTSQPVVIQQKAPCDDGNILGTLAGGAAGGILGNQVGKGSGKTVATIGGAVGGAYLGREHIPLNGSTCR